MINELTPPVPIPQPDTSLFAQLMPASGADGALMLVTVLSFAVLGGLLLWFFWPKRDAYAISTDTPETDDAVARWAVRRDATTIIECSRRLERKLAKELDDNRGAKVAFHLTCLDRDAAKKALSEANAEIAKLKAQLASANAELGLPTDGPDENGSAYARLRQWKDWSDEHGDEIEELRAEVARLRRAREE